MNNCEWFYGYAISKFLPTSGFKLIDCKYTSNSSKGCVLEVDLEYPKKLRELHNDYPFALDKIEIKREIVSKYELKISDLNNITIGNVKKIVPNFFEKNDERYYQNLQLYLRLGLKLKKNTSSIRIQYITMIKTIYWTQHTKKNRIQINEYFCIWKNNWKRKK